MKHRVCNNFGLRSRTTHRIGTQCTGGALVHAWHTFLLLHSSILLLSSSTLLHALTVVHVVQMWTVECVTACDSVLTVYNLGTKWAGEWICIEHCRSTHCRYLHVYCTVCRLNFQVLCVVHCSYISVHFILVLHVVHVQCGTSTSTALVCCVTVYTVYVQWTRKFICSVHWLRKHYWNVKLQCTQWSHSVAVLCVVHRSYTLGVQSVPEVVCCRKKLTFAKMFLARQ